MSNCNPCLTHADTKPKLSAASRPTISDPTLYQRLVGGLQYLTFTRSDLCYAIQHIFLVMHDPLAPHLAALKCIIRYLKGTLHHGLLIHPSKNFSLTAYSDADWAGCPDTR